MGMFFSNLAKVYSLRYMEIADMRRRWNWIIFTSLIISGTIGVILAIILKILQIINYPPVNEKIAEGVITNPDQYLLSVIVILILGLALMCGLHDRPKS